MPSLFFSYSHEDEQLRDELETHLAQVKRQGLVSSIHDRRITAGEDLDRAIDSYLDNADIVLCLMSPSFIASNYCYSREMARALERHDGGKCRVIPVILRHCDWKNTPLSKLRATPRDAKPVKAWDDRDEAFAYVVDDIRKALESLGASNAAPVELPLETKSADPGAAVISRLRSSNLAVAKTATDLEKRKFLRHAFEQCAELVANTADELHSRSPEIESDFVKLDQNRFTCALYKNGKKTSGITVYLGGMGGREITSICYHLSDSGEVGSMNGSFSVEADGERLSFNNQFGRIGFGGDGKLTPEAVAEAIWSVLLEPLQRRP